MRVRDRTQCSLHILACAILEIPYSDNTVRELALFIPLAEMDANSVRMARTQGTK